MKQIELGNLFKTSLKSIAVFRLCWKTNCCKFPVSHFCGFDSMIFMSVLAKLLGRQSENMAQGMLLLVYKTQQHKISGYNF